MGLKYSWSAVKAAGLDCDVEVITGMISRLELNFYFGYRSLLAHLFFLLNSRIMPHDSNFQQQSNYPWAI